MNNKLSRDGQHFFAAEFAVALDGKPDPALRVGAIGIGTSPKDARETALFEWGAQYGQPIAAAIAHHLAQKPPKPTPKQPHVVLGDDMLFHGPVGLRGSAKDPEAASSDDVVKRVAQVVHPRLGATGAFRSATIMVVIEGDRVESGECRINGSVSAALLKDLEKLQWAAAAPTYMFKLYFVAAPAG